jgi:hypothetical protein
MKYSTDSNTIRHCGLDCIMLRTSSLRFISEGIRIQSCG